MRNDNKKPGLDQSERGKRAGFDRKTGAPIGSGSGAGDPNENAEDYDSDLGRNPPESAPGRG